MSIILNGTEINHDGLYYNGTKIKQVVFNGTVVFDTIEDSKSFTSTSTDIIPSLPVQVRTGVRQAFSFTLPHANAVVDSITPRAAPVGAIATVVSFSNTGCTIEISGLELGAYAQIIRLNVNYHYYI